MKPTITLSIALSLAAAAPLAGQDEAKLTKRQEAMLARAFQRLDGDSNGTVEKKEFPGSAAQFRAMDKDGNGKVTTDEFRGSAQARRLLQASYRNSQEPRERTTAVGLRPERMEHIKRFDTNRDGKVTAKEWRGAPSAFSTLDANQDGVIDRKDRDIAEQEAETTRPPALPRFPGPLPSVEKLMKKLDRNKDDRLSAREAARDRDLLAAFLWADTNNDRYLEKNELERLARTVSMRIQARNRGTGARPQAFRVPFSAWDKDNDEKLSPEEWVSRRYLFSRIDADRDGMVTKLEVDRYQRSVEHEDFLGRYDLDENGSVTLKEFGGSPAAFARADTNGDGVINRRDR